MRFPIVPLHVKMMGMDAGDVGVITGSFFFMAGLLSIPLGRASDRFGRKGLAACGLLLLGTSSFLLCLGRTLFQFTAVYMIFGAGLAAFGPTMMSWVADAAPPDRVGRSYGWYATALFCGMSLGPSAGGLLGHAAGFRLVFVTSGVLLLAACFILLVFFPRDPAPDAEAATRPRESNESDGRGLNLPLIGCWLAALGGCFGLGTFVAFIPLHAHDCGLTLPVIGLIFTFQGLFNATSRIPFGMMSDATRDRRRLVFIGLIGFIASIAGFGFCRTALSFYVVAATLGVSMGLAFTSTAALIVESAPRRHRGLAMGGYNTAIYTGMMMSSALMGYVIRGAGYKIGFWVAASVISIFLTAFMVLMKDFTPCGRLRTCEA
jgi:MFS transporter, DHA1 family, multidrug resistance protein